MTRNAVRRLAFLAFVAVALAALTGAAHAAPLLLDAKPVNNSFVGRGTVNFSVNITGDFDASTVRLFVISQNAFQQGEAWDNFSMACTAATCTRSVSFAVAGSDTLEFFYFTANDTSGAQSNLGNGTAPLRFTIDRNPPSISFVSPANGSFVSGVANVSASISDAVSGVNASSVRLSLDNATWSNMTGTATFNGTASFSSHVNNASAAIFIFASDNVGNNATASVNVTVDNEAPRLVVVSPSPGEFLTGIASFSANVSDAYSGVSSVSYAISSSSGALSCSALCTALFNTSQLADGSYTLKFTANDNAGNSNASGINVSVKNSNATVVVTPSGHLRGVVTVSATIANPGGAVTSVELSIDALRQAMSCNAAFTSCSHSLDTKLLADGSYTLSATANNTLGSPWTGSSAVVIDNTAPVVTLNVPSVAKGVLDIRASVTETNLASATAKIDGSISLTMTCAADCLAQYDTSQLSDGAHTIEVTATDKAGSAAAKSASVVTDNNAPSLTFLKIAPVHSEALADVEFTAGFSDAGSGVSSAKLVISHLSSDTELAMAKAGSVWYAKASIKAFGPYSVDIAAADAAGNSKTFEDSGYFYIGPLSAGDGVCSSSENFCLSPLDCAAPQCSSGVVQCASGVPSCSAPAQCGDAVCSESESCSSCAQDCGTCAALAAAAPQPLPSVPAGAGGRTSAPGPPLSDTIVKLIEQNPLLFVAIIVVIIIAAAVLVKRQRRPKYVKMWELYGEK